MSKIPLLLLPGTLCDGRLWEPQVRALSDIADCRVADVGAWPSLSELAKVILSDAPPRFAVAGLSFGGILALELYRQAPERISHMALIDTNARPDTEAGIAAKDEQWQIASEQGLEALLSDKLIPMYLAPENSQNDSLIQILVDMALDNGMSVFRNQIDAVLARPDSRPDLPSITCPTLVLCGAQDIICPVDRHEEIAESIPGATLKLLEQCGHIATLEQTEQVNTALRELLSQ